MTRPMWMKHSSAAIAVFALVSVDLAGRAQQPGFSSGADLLDKPQVFRTAAATIRVTAIKGLVYPWALAFLPNGDILVTEQSRNSLRIIRSGVLDPTPIAGLPLGITSVRRDTAGVDIALHPRFAENRLVYIAYWKPRPGGGDVRTAALVRGRFDGGTSLADVREIFASSSWMDGPSAARIAFGRDGKIYMTIGTPLSAGTERGPFVGLASWAQDPGEHAGKVLRLNEDGSTPEDNPFVGRTGYRPEIYAFGIRNALGLIVHPETGDLWATDNGPQGGDEINTIRRGLNYGWPVVTYGRAYTTDPDGTRSGLPPPTVQPPTSAPDMEEPVTFYKPSIAISGMTFYTGDKFPQWKGNLLVGGLAGTQLSRLAFNERGLESRREALLLELRQRIRDVRQGPDGLLYLTTDMRDGAILKIEPVEDPMKLVTGRVHRNLYFVASPRTTTQNRATR